MTCGKIKPTNQPTNQPMAYLILFGILSFWNDFGRYLLRFCMVAPLGLKRNIGKMLDENNTRGQHVDLNKSWKYRPIKKQLYDHLPPISQIIQKRQTRHASHCWTSKDKLISDVYLWTLTCYTSVDWPAKMYIHQLWAEVGCHLEDLPRMMTDWGSW